MNINKYMYLLTVSCNVHIRMRCLKGYKDKQGKLEVFPVYTIRTYNGRKNVAQVIVNMVDRVR